MTRSPLALLLCSSALAGAACGGRGSPDAGLFVPQETPSRQTVTFQIANTTSSDAWVITGGSFCDPFGIDRNGSAGGFVPLELALGFQCGCECPAPPSAGPTSFHRIAAGASYAISWDARELHAVQIETSCAQGDVPGFAGASQPVPAGGYRVNLGFAAPPAGCTAIGDDASCDPSPGATPPPIQERCAADLVLPKTFALPASGDLSVPVTLD